MLMIRLQRVGRRHAPSYRVVVTEKASGPRAGKSVENLGHYDARLEKGKDFIVKTERVKYWLSVGAQPSGTVHNLLVREGIISGKKRDVRPSKTIKKTETAQTVQAEQTPQTITETVQTTNEEVKIEDKVEEAAQEASV